MPDWDSTMRELQGRSGVLSRDLMEKYLSRCECPSCPTYAECARNAGELTFCLSGRSSCIQQKKVCYCPGCPVHQELDLEFMYYCVNGDEGEQRSE